MTIDDTLLPMMQFRIAKIGSISFLELRGFKSVALSATVQEADYDK
jgi:hypothetical protein